MTATKSDRTKISSALTGVAGEYFVAAKLFDGATGTLT
jgi:hypothetical protein